MNDLKFAASGFVGRAPTMSGYSCGGFALSIVDILQELERMGQSASALTIRNSLGAGFRSHSSLTPLATSH